jgi:hypothetical protein
MTTIKPSGMFATPYGVEVPVHRSTKPVKGDPDGYLFGPDAVAFCSGIYDQKERERFVADARRLGHFPAIEDYGGHTLPRLPLPRPIQAAYPRLRAIGAGPVEEWITGTLEHARWRDRADFLIRIIGENMEATVPSASDAMRPVYAIGLSLLLTASLEHLGETEIDCIEAAAFYALTDHPLWGSAGRTWLKPYRETWFRDWALARPRYTAFGGALAKARDTRGWLFGLEDWR